MALIPRNGKPKPVNYSEFSYGILRIHKSGGLRMQSLYFSSACSSDWGKRFSVPIKSFCRFLSE
jgi:hypothetical protein